MRIDLLITDVGLPGGMSGAKSPPPRVCGGALKVLLTTGFAENAAIGNGHLGQELDVITKPFELSTLGNKIRDMLDR